MCGRAEKTKHERFLVGRTAVRLKFAGAPAGDNTITKEAGRGGNALAAAEKTVWLTLKPSWTN